MAARVHVRSRPVATTGWARFLRDALDERDWSAAELARHIDGRLGTGEISKWLNGKVTPGLASIRAVCRALDVPAVQGMIAAGHLTPDDVGVTVINRPRSIEPEDLSNDELIGVLARRLKATADEQGESEKSEESDQFPAPSEDETPAPPAVNRPSLIKGRLEGEQIAARRRRS